MPCATSSVFCRTAKPSTPSPRHVFQYLPGRTRTSVSPIARTIEERLTCWWHDRRRATSREGDAITSSGHHRHHQTSDWCGRTRHCFGCLNGLATTASRAILTSPDARNLSLMRANGPSCGDRPPCSLAHHRFHRELYARFTPPRARPRRLPARLRSAFQDNALLFQPVIDRVPNLFALAEEIAGG